MRGMKDVLETRVGPLAGVGAMERYPGGALRGVVLLRENRVSVPSLGAELTPNWSYGSARAKYAHSVSFHESGALKCVRLESQVTVSLPSVGEIPAEKITFYESGAVKRVFPLDGRISGYWTEADERTLAPRLTLRLPCAEISSLVSAISFRESGAVASVTLWPGETVRLEAGGRAYRARIGFSIGEAGELATLEPARPTPVPTPLGEMAAYDPEAVGLSADRNSLALDPSGNVTGLKSLAVLDAGGAAPLRIEPHSRPHPLEDGRLRHFPLSIRFEGGAVKVARDGTLPLEEWEFPPGAGISARPFADRPFARIFLGTGAAWAAAKPGQPEASPAAL
jgi:hypothetical protein